MFGLFDGLFGNDSIGQATADALEMCIIDEMEREDEEEDEEDKI